jgi:hypothetical protein
MTKYILTYVNLPNDVTCDLDKEFGMLLQLMAYVKVHYPNYSSYGITVLNAGGKASIEMK